MGSPDFALPALEALAREHQVVGVVTQPDRPAGRGRSLVPSPVKRLALELGLPLFQPQTLRTPEAVAHLATWEPEVIVVAAFGQILRAEVLNLPPHGCLNLHASLLPRWRGAAPIPAAILIGDAVTGVTVMRMNEGLDTGPLLAQREVPIAPDDTTASLGAKLAQTGADLLREVLPPYLSGELTSQPQPEESVTYAPQLRKEDGRLDWLQPAVELDRRVRAFYPWPGAFTTWAGRQLKVLRAAPVPAWRGSSPPGRVFVLNGGVVVATGSGALQLLDVQLAGKRAMDVESFVRGQRDFIGALLGE